MPAIKGACCPSRSVRWGSCTATSARARCTRSGNRSSTPTWRSTPANAYGVASVVFWALIVIISVKYLLLVMRADNHGEGGILALTALLMPARRAAGRHEAGDHRARRVRHRAALRRRSDHAGHLGAERGRGVRGGDARRSRRGSSRSSVVILSCCSPSSGVAPSTISRVFGPVMVVWFVVLGVLGLAPDHRQPRRAAGRLADATASSSSSTSRPRRSWRSVRSSSSSPAARRCTPTWATSVADRSRSPGTPWSCRRCCSTTSVRPRCWRRARRGGRQPVLPDGAVVGGRRRSPSWRRWPPSSPPRR